MASKLRIILIVGCCLLLSMAGASAAGILLLAKSGAPPVCVPGNSTGFMDFSVCSNVGITAAVF